MAGADLFSKEPPAFPVTCGADDGLVEGGHEQDRQQT